MKLPKNGISLLQKENSQCNKSALLTVCLREFKFLATVLKEILAQANILTDFIRRYYQHKIIYYTYSYVVGA